MARRNFETGDACCRRSTLLKYLNSLKINLFHDICKWFALNWEINRNSFQIQEALFGANKQTILP